MDTSVPVNFMDKLYKNDIIKSRFVLKKGKYMKKDRKTVQNALIMVFEFGINMLVPIVLCTLFGVWLGQKIQINWIVIPFFFLGALAGYTNIFKLARQFMKENDSKKPQNTNGKETIERKEEKNP